jgi:hypothetical protein
MRKIIATIAMVAAFGTTTFTTHAEAKNALPWVVGGVIGGLVLGTILNDHHHRHERTPIYVQPQPRCWIEYRTRWNPYFGYYEQVPVEFCR